MSEDRLVQLLIEIRELVKRIDHEMPEPCVTRSYFQCQRVYLLIEKARQLAIARTSESAGGDDE